MASRSGILHDTTKQLTLERVYSNMVVRDALRIDQAANDYAGAEHMVFACLILANQATHGFVSEALHPGDQLRELRAGASGGCEPGMVWLSRLWNRRIAQLDPATVHHSRGCHRPSQQHNAGPTGLHRETNCCGSSPLALSHASFDHGAASVPPTESLPTKEIDRE